MSTSYADLKANLAALRQQMKDTAKTWFKTESAALFAAHPLLTEFGWTQYTPYFNDGDECIFSVHTDLESLTFGFEGGVPDEEGEASDYWDRYESIYNIFESPYAREGVKAGLEAHAAACIAVADFLNAFEEDDLEDMFGDHVEITVSRDGVETSRYSHD